MIWLVEASFSAGSSCHMQGCLLTGEGMEAFKSINLVKEAFFMNLRPIAGIDVGKFFSEMAITSLDGERIAISM